MSVWVYIAAGAYLVINLITYIYYASDKKRAKKGAWRVPEARLLALAACFGAAGALAAMFIKRHKTNHKKFTICVPLFLVLQAALVILLIIYL